MKNDENDEVKLVSLLTEGDKIAFSKLYEHYSPALLHKLNRLLPTEELMLEIHQMAFVRLWDMRAKIIPGQSIWPLIHTIARNLAVDYFRRSATDEAVRKALLTQATLYYELDEPTDAMEQLSDELSKAIDKLPTKRKEIFLLCKFQGKSYEEAAKIHGVSVGTIKDHMAKAMRFLKQELGTKLFMLLITLLSLLS